MHEVVGEDRDLLGALPERRHHDLDHVQTVVEVLAEAAAGHRLLEVLVGGREDAHVDLHGGPPPHPGELAVLEDVEELALQGRVKIADLVEEDGPAIRRLELADLELMRTGEGAALVPEELALQQLARDRRAVDLDERAALAHRLLVDRARDHVLARAGLAHDEHRDVDAGGLLDDLAHLTHPRAAPQPDFLAQPRARIVVRRAIPAAAGARERALDDVLKVFGAEGLLQEVVRAERGGLRGGNTRVGVREEDDRPRRAPLGLQTPQEIVRVTAQVEQAEDEAPLAHLSERLVDGADRDHLVSPLTQELDEVMRQRRPRTRQEHKSILHRVAHVLRVMDSLVLRWLRRKNVDTSPCKALGKAK